MNDGKFCVALEISVDSQGCISASLSLEAVAFIVWRNFTDGHRKPFNESMCLDWNIGRAVQFVGEREFFRDCDLDC